MRLLFVIALICLLPLARSSADETVPTASNWTSVDHFIKLDKESNSDKPSNQDEQYEKAAKNFLATKIQHQTYEYYQAAKKGEAVKGGELLLRVWCDICLLYTSPSPRD